MTIPIFFYNSFLCSIDKMLYWSSDKSPQFFYLEKSLPEAIGWVHPQQVTLSKSSTLFCILLICLVNLVTKLLVKKSNAEHFWTTRKLNKKYHPGWQICRHILIRYFEILRGTFAGSLADVIFQEFIASVWPVWRWMQLSADMLPRVVGPWAFRGNRFKSCICSGGCPCVS